MQGQTKIISLIDSCVSFDDLPQTLLFVGEFGSGRHMLCNYIADKFSVECVDLNKKLLKQDSKDTTSLHDRIEHIYFEDTYKLYVLNMDDPAIQEKHQNAILKFLEEPPASLHIILIAENTTSIISTVLNRCEVYYLQSYSDDFLKSFITNKANEEIVLQIAKTPGQIMLCNRLNLNNIVSYANLVVEKAGYSNPANVLKISEKLAYKDEEEKINPKLFFRILLYCAEQNYIKNNNKSNEQVFFKTHALLKHSNIAHVNLQHVFENYLYSLREAFEGVN